MNDRYYIAADGGGTKTEFLLFDPDGTVISRRVGAASNPNDIGIGKSVALLSEGLASLSENRKIIAAFLGVAGLASGENKRLVGDALRTAHPKFPVFADTDGVNAVALGGEGVKMALISGTGSVVFARSSDELVRIGGWGYLFDLGGSGYDIGADAVRAALAELDGIGEKTLLTELLSRETGSGMWQSLGTLYERGKPYIASLAPTVFEAAELSDNAAHEIIYKNCERLAVLIHRASEVSRSHKIAVSGGIFENFRSAMMQRLAPLCSDIEFVFPTLPPIYGAAREAVRLGGGELSAEFEMNFEISYKRIRSQC